MELIKLEWARRLSSVTVPRIANAPQLEYDIIKAHSETLELERTMLLAKRPGIVRFLITNTYSKAPSYQSGLQAIATRNSYILDVILGNTEGIVMEVKNLE